MIAITSRSIIAIIVIFRIKWKENKVENETRGEAPK